MLVFRYILDRIGIAHGYYFKKTESDKELKRKQIYIYIYIYIYIHIHRYIFVEADDNFKIVEKKLRSTRKRRHDTEKENKSREISVSGIS